MVLFSRNYYTIQCSIKLIIKKKTKKKTLILSNRNAVCLKYCFYIHRINETGEKNYHRRWFFQICYLQTSYLLVSNVSLVWEAWITILLQLFLFTASKFCLCFWGVRVVFIFMCSSGLSGSTATSRITVQSLKLLCLKSVNPKHVLSIQKSNVAYSCSKANTFWKTTKAKHMSYGK